MAAAKTDEEKRAIVDEICEKIISNNISLRKATEDNRPISKSTFLDWCSENKGFADQYARAMVARSDAMADEILEIADESANDWQIDPETGKEYINHEVVQRSRLKIDTRKWLMGKMAPKKYGDKLDVTSAGEQIKPNVIYLGTGLPPADEATS